MELLQAIIPADRVPIMISAVKLYNQQLKSKGSPAQVKWRATKQIDNETLVELECNTILDVYAIGRYYGMLSYATLGSAATN